MDTVTYIGEHLWVGQLGHVLIVLAFVSALFSAYSYYHGIKNEESSWRGLGRIGFGIHGVSIFIVIGLIFFAMFSKMYEYIYVYRTVSDDLPFKYLFAAFWEDQEGSFLLWMFWHIVLGGILIWKAGKWESSVMVTLAVIQAFIGSMLLGFYVPFVEEELKIGSNPFSLIRDVFEGPIFANADYLTVVKGQGLNPLLQNYWMTIHPPTLFLGFASVSIPFCFSVAGLSLGTHKEVMPVLLKWALFSSFMLGLGILMGGAWAYEALTFGGYWAWDPVENTSLVPWLILVAGVHTNLIAKSTQYAVRTTYFYYLLALILILYSTFLTRSGILGETSVHAFTTLGLETQLIGFIVFFIGLSAYKFWKGSKTIPTQKKEESIYSREFWMFVGSLVLFFSGIMMTAATSLPVYNEIARLFDENFVGFVIDDPMHHHNKYQIWIGIFMGLLAGTTILMRYGALNWSTYRQRFTKHVLGSALVSLAIGAYIQSTLQITAWQQYFFLFSGVYVIIANFDYLQRFINNNWKLAGSTVSHMGFGILILGIMYSGLNQKVISTNPFVQQGFLDRETAQKAVVLIKDQPFFTTDYWVNYVTDSLEGNLRTYQIDFQKVNKDNEVLDEFTTEPSAIYNNDFTQIAAFNPGTEHKLTYDVFTQITPPAHLQDVEIAKQVEDSLNYLSHLVQENSSFEEETYTANVHQIQFNYPFQASEHGNLDDYDLTIGLPLTITNKRSGRVHEIVPGLGLKDALIYQFPVVVDDLGIKIKLSEDIFTQVFTEEDDLEYEFVNVRQGEIISWKGMEIVLEGFNRTPSHKNYSPQENDIALGARLVVRTEQDSSYLIQPIFIIRNNQQFSIKEYLPQTGLHARFTKIDPATEDMTFALALDDRNQQDFEMFIADDVPRSDILVLQANIFPGINLVWLGCLMMLFGLLMSLIAKRKAA